MPILLPAAVLGAAAGAAATQVMVAAEGAAIPICYGRVRVGARIFAAAVLDRRLVLGCLWCVGPIHSVESIEIDDAAPAADVKIQHYLGSPSQGVSSLLAAAIPGYADTLVASVDGTQLGMAYSVLRIPARLGGGFPRVAAVVRGRKVADPRTSGGAAAWSRNPALIAADFIASAAYGQGLAVSDADLSAAADACDEVMADGQPRRALDIAIEQELPAAQWSEVLAGYAGCFLARDGNAVRLVPDRPAASSRAISAADIVEGSLRLRQRAKRDVPTVVRVEWTDTGVTPWRTREAIAQLAGVDLGTTPRREDRISLPGVTSYAQAHREAVERLNAAQRLLEVEFVTFDFGLSTQRGDVVKLLHPEWMGPRWWRITDVRLTAPGRWAVTAREYASAVYSDAVLSDVTGLPPGLPSDDTVEPPPAVWIDVLPVEVAVDGVLRAPITVRWQSSTDPYLYGYDVELRSGSGGTWQVLASVSVDRLDAAAYTTPGVDVSARVRAVSVAGLRSAWTLSSANAAEKTAPPGNVRGLAWDGAAFAWSRLADADLAGYLVRWQQGRRTTWADATPMHDGIVGDTPWRPLRRPTGPATVLVCGVDSSGNVSRLPAVLALDLPATVLANVLFSFDFGGWPGSIAGASISAGAVRADSTVAYWTGNGLPAWTYDSDPAWPAAAYAALTYAAAALRLPADVLGERVTLSATVDGETWTIEYRWDSPGPYWTRDTEAAWTGDTAPVWSYGDWQPWPGEVQARSEALELRVRCGAGTTQGVLSALVLSVDTPDRTAVVSGVTLAADGSRVPLPVPAWRVLRAVVGTLYGTGTAATVRVLDRDSGAGPLVRAYDSTGTGVAATADFHLTGY